MLKRLLSGSSKYKTHRKKIQDLDYELRALGSKPLLNKEKERFRGRFYRIEGSIKSNKSKNSEQENEDLNKMLNDFKKCHSHLFVTEGPFDSTKNMAHTSRTQESRYYLRSSAKNEDVEENCKTSTEAYYEILSEINSFRRSLNPAEVKINREKCVSIINQMRSSISKFGFSEEQKSKLHEHFTSLEAIVQSNSNEPSRNFDRNQQKGFKSNTYQVQTANSTAHSDKYQSDVNSRHSVRTHGAWSEPLPKNEDARSNFRTETDNKWNKTLKTNTKEKNWTAPGSGQQPSGVHFNRNSFDERQNDFQKYKNHTEFLVENETLSQKRHYSKSSVCSVQGPDKWYNTTNNTQSYTEMIAMQVFCSNKNVADTEKLQDREFTQCCKERTTKPDESYYSKNSELNSLQNNAEEMRLEQHKKSADSTFEGITSSFFRETNLDEIQSNSSLQTKYKDRLKRDRDTAKSQTNAYTQTEHLEQKSTKPGGSNYTRNSSLYGTQSSCFAETECRSDSLPKTNSYCGSDLNYRKIYNSEKSQNYRANMPLKKIDIQTQLHHQTDDFRTNKVDKDYHKYQGYQENNLNNINNRKQGACEQTQSNISQEQYYTLLSGRPGTETLSNEDTETLNLQQKYQQENKIRGRGRRSFERGASYEHAYFPKQQETETGNDRFNIQHSTQELHEYNHHHNYYENWNSQNENTLQHFTYDQSRPNEYESRSHQDETPAEEPLQILDVHEYFRDDFDLNSVDDLDYMERIFRLGEYAATFKNMVENFDDEKDSIPYFVLDEKLMNLIDKLDKIKCQHEPEVTAAKVQLIEFIKQLHTTLDSRAKVF